MTITNNTNDDFTIKFINHDSIDAITTLDKKTLAAKKKAVIDACLDFSKITKERKAELINKTEKFNKLNNATERAIDVFYIFLITIKTSNNKNYSTTKTAFMSSIKQVREMLFLYSYFNIENILSQNLLVHKNKSLLHNITCLTIKPEFETINLKHPIYNVYNIEEVTNKLSLSSIEIEFSTK